MLHSQPWRWDEVTDTKWQQPAPEVYALAERWRRDGRNYILDLGCGLGRHSLFLAAEGFVVDAFDLSEIGVAALTKAATERCLPIEARVGDMKALPYPDKGFDGIVAFNVIYHADRQGVEQVIAEITRVLADSGEVFLTLISKQNPSFSDPTNRVIDANTMIKTSGHEADVPHYFVDEAEVRRLLGGFEIFRFAHVEEIEKDGRGCHYFILARKR
ncbi:MAG TPA: class I SAM-dependent methyltransferase [Negativicutes bacterium]|nr:class I SAM-dependent methyltransferase [Negativicutes bacterium]